MMRTYEVDRSKAYYDEESDVLIVALGDYDQGMIDHEDDLGGNVYLQYSWPSNQPAFVEVWHFARDGRTFPATIEVNSDEPFIVSVATANAA